MTRRLTTPIIALLVWLSAAPATRAQEAAAADAFAGYNYLRDSTFNESYRNGWSVGASKRLNSWLSIAGEYDDNRRTFENLVGDLRFNIRAGLVGGRVSFRVKRFTEFGQLLVGAIRVSSDVLGTKSSTMRGAAQGGIGVDYALGDSLAWRAQLDLRLSSNSLQDSGRHVRALTAIVFTVH